MNVQELIELLETVEDKSIPIVISGEYYRLNEASAEVFSCIIGGYYSYSNKELKLKTNSLVLIS